MPEENEKRRAASQGARVRALSKRLESKTTTDAKERKGSAVRKRSGSIPNITKRTANAPGTPEGAGPEVQADAADGSPNPTAGSWTNIPSQGGISVLTEQSVDVDSDDNEHTPFDREISGMTEEQLRDRLKESHRELTRELKRSNEKDAHVAALDEQLRDALDANDIIGVERDNARATLLDAETRCTDLATELAEHDSLGGNARKELNDDDPINELVSELQAMSQQHDVETSEYKMNIDALKHSLSEQDRSRSAAFLEQEQEMAKLRRDLMNAEAAFKSEKDAATRASIDHNAKFLELRNEYQNEMTRIDQNRSRENTDLREKMQQERHDVEKLRSELDAATSNRQVGFSASDGQTSDIFRMLTQLCETTSKMNERIESLEKPKSVDGELVDQKKHTTHTFGKDLNLGVKRELNKNAPDFVPFESVQKHDHQFSVHFI